MQIKKKRGVLLPPAVGYSFKILIKLVRINSISIKYVPRLIILGIINLINLPFRVFERNFINPGISKKLIFQNPIFIIGHWRSGTTYLHNLLCQDPNMAYVTTYQSVFPDTLFNKLGRFIFQNFTKLLIPAKRKGDNVILDTSYPQEEEFALGDKTPICFYYLWMFPRKMIKYYNRYIRFNNIEIDELESWKLDYKLLIKKVLQNTNADVFLSKNPSNTGRIKVLLEMFPNAKFIHIHRNPVEVILSTLNFYDKMLPHLQLQSIEKEQLEKNILCIYKKLMSDYFNQNELIPNGNLFEVAFKDLEENPAGIAENIYDSLSLKDFEKAKPLFDKYIVENKNYKKNKHIISRKLLNQILHDCDFTMKQLNYTIPENLEITDE